MLAILTAIVLSQIPATPGGTYRMPGNFESFSYTVQPKENVIFKIALTREVEEKGLKREVTEIVASYNLMDSQIYGWKKNIQKWQKKNDLEFVDFKNNTVTFISGNLARERRGEATKNAALRDKNPFDFSK